MAIAKTGVIVSEEHRLAALTRARGVLASPIIKVRGKWLPDEARLDFGTWLDHLAESYGLPTPAANRDGDVVHYGMLANGEFTRWIDDLDDCPPQDILGG